MTFTRDQRQNAYKKLSSEAQDFVMSNETTDLIANIIKEGGIDKEYVNIVDSEILDWMYGLQTLDKAIENIAKESGKTTADLTILKNKLQENVLDVLKYLGVQENPTSSVEKQDIGVNNSFRTLKENELIEQGKSKMPEEKRRVIEELPWRDYVQDIAFLNKLSLEQIESFGKETMLVIFGFESRDKFADNLIRETKLAPDLAKSLREMVDEKILKVIERKVNGEPEPTTQEIDLDDKEKLRSTPNHVIIEAQKSKLPEKEIEAINSTPWQEIVKDIALRNKLGIGQAAILEKETLFVLYKLEKEDDYHTNITREAELNKDLADPVTNAISLEVFKVIKDKVNGTIPSPVLDNSVNQSTPVNLPMVEKGETAHDVPHTEPAKNPGQVSIPDYRYSAGKDPYKEPLV
jgi:hypothetical protein